jgi:sulfonate dioxygenase
MPGERGGVYHLTTANVDSQLALYVAQRGVVVFRDQDFIDQPPEWQLNEWGT